MKRYEIVLLQGAQSDLLSIYSLQGERVYKRVDQALGILRVFPEAGPLHFGQQIRRLIVTKTTLAVFFSIAGQRVMVAAILDLRQDPEAIRKRLTSP